MLSDSPQIAMEDWLAQFRARRVGLALSGGGARGLAHIGVIKALAAFGIYPTIIAGTSAGSLIGAGFAAGKDWRALAEMAQQVFWPRLLIGRLLERFCEQQLPATFEQLSLPFAAVATEFPAKRTVVLTTGELPSAISASCALRVVRRPVQRAGLTLKDGGYTCVLPAQICRALGAEIVISSDVWELSGVIRSLGCDSTHWLFPAHYREAVAHSDWLIQPKIPLTSYLPTAAHLRCLINAGEQATNQSLALRGSRLLEDKT